MKESTFSLEKIRFWKNKINELKVNLQCSSRRETEVR